MNLFPGLGEEQIVFAQRAPQALFSLPLEEIDLEFEQMQNLEEEAAALRDDAENEALSGEWISFGQRETSLCNQDISLRQILKDLSTTKDLNSITRKVRGLWYRGFEIAMIDAVHRKLKPLLITYRKIVEDYAVAKASSDNPTHVKDLLT